MRRKNNMPIGALVPYTCGIARAFTKYMENAMSPFGRILELNNQRHILEYG
jgi:hypothetical protein